MLSGKFVAVFRDNGMKEELDVANGNTVVKQKLEEMQTRMFKKCVLRTFYCCLFEP